MVVTLSALRTSRLYPQETFLVLISVRGWVQPQGHVAAGRIMSMKKSNDTIGNGTRDLLACSAVPQPTAPPSAPRPSQWLDLLVGHNACRREACKITVQTVTIFVHFEICALSGFSQRKIPKQRRSHFHRSVRPISRFVDLSVKFSKFREH
jgi:hypothetical protein